MNIRTGTLSALVVGCWAILACFSTPAHADEYRAFWVDAWSSGFKSQIQVEQLLGKVGSATEIGRIREANCNAVFVQVRRRADVCYPSAVGEPYMTGLNPSNFNALDAMIAAAHDTTGGKQRIEVHAWIVSFMTASDSPVYHAHKDPSDPDNYWITQYYEGDEPTDQPLDPGHPRVSEYLTDVCMDLVNNHDIDGLHYDYIRFKSFSEGYNPTSVARYNERYSLSGKPSPSNEQFKQWRRDQITQFVRRVYAHTLRDRPEVKISAALVTWNPSPSSSTRSAFMNTRPYYDTYCDWDAWMQEGILDISIPMTYYDQSSYSNDYRRWMNFQKNRKANRHNIVGPGIYMNSLSNAITQLQLTRDPSDIGNYSEGFCGFSYRVPYASGYWDGFKPTLVSSVTQIQANIPDMLWKSAPTQGHIMGTVTDYVTGGWADGAQVNLTGPESRTITCDGTGFYAFIDLAPGTYTLTAIHTTGPNTVVNVAVTAGMMTERDINLGGSETLAITNIQAGDITQNTARITWATNFPATARVEYGVDTHYGEWSYTDHTYLTSHNILLGNLTPGTLYHYRVYSDEASGGAVSYDQTFLTAGPPQITDIRIEDLSSASATITWTTSAPADGQIEFGLDRSYSESTALDTNATTSHRATLTGLTPLTTFHLRIRAAHTGGINYSADQAITTIVDEPDIIIDESDPGFANTSPNNRQWGLGSISTIPKIGMYYLYAPGIGSTDENDATYKCTWTPDIPREGNWDVYVFCQVGHNRNTGAPYKIVYDGNEITRIVNQYATTNDASGWFLIGEDIPLQIGSSAYVQCSNNSVDTNFVSADAAKFVYQGTGDMTPPTTPTITDDGVITHSVTELYAEWVAEDSETGIEHVEYRIVDSEEAVVRDWTSVGAANSFTATGLTLQQGATYLIEVQAFNGDGLVSGVGTSDGITVFRYDIDGDGTVDGDDMAACQFCISGANVVYPDAIDYDCGRFDNDLDGDVDMEDFGVFQRCLTGIAPLNVDCFNN